MRHRSDPLAGIRKAGGAAFRSRLFPPKEEAENSAYGFTGDGAQVASYGTSASKWWLRSPSANNNEYAVEWATATGITSGTGNGNFDPNGNITREQLVSMICRYVVLIGADITDETQGEMPAFSDSDAVSGYAKEAMDWAISEGIIQGRGGKIAPNDNSTCAEVATILVRLVNYLTK